MQSSLPKENRTLRTNFLDVRDIICGQRVWKKKKNTSEGSVGITFCNPAVVRVADREKTFAAQGSDGSFSGAREDDILTAALETLEHRGRV
jgi:hypothetical protein